MTHTLSSRAADRWRFAASIGLGLFAVYSVVRFYQSPCDYIWMMLPYIAVALSSFVNRTFGWVLVHGTALTVALMYPLLRPMLIGKAPCDFAYVPPVLYGLAVAFVIHTWRSGRMLDKVESTQKRLRAIVDVNLDAIVAVDAQGVVKEFNPAAETTFGVDRGQVIGRPAEEILFPPHMRGRGLLESGIGFSVETTGRRSDGTTFPMELTVARLKAPGEPELLSASIRDLSARTDAEQARRESEAKSRFLATMSHELRTPLNSVLGFTQLLRMPNITPERQDRYIDNIEQSGKHLLDLVNEVLDLTKIESGNLELQPAETNLLAVMQDAATKVRHMAEERNIALTVDAIQPVPIKLDPMRLEQVLLNLISNAIKFTPEGGSVIVSSRSVGDAVLVSVSDTGVGIATEDRNRIFEEFTQLESGRARSHDGAGLGLALAKRLVERMGGYIEVESEVGRGSTFKVTVPRRASMSVLRLPAGQTG